MSAPPRPLTQVHFRDEIRLLNGREIDRDLPAWRAQAEANRPRWSAGPGFAGLLGERAAFRDLTAVVCAPGPSLADSYEAIRAHRDRLVVIALDSALLPLFGAGIAADFVFTRDAGPEPGRLLQGLATPALRLILPVTADPAFVAAFPGPTFFYAPDDDRPDLAAWRESLPGVAPLPLKPSAGAMTLLAAAALGFDTLVLAGFDYAFTDDRLYVDGCRRLAGPDFAGRHRDTADPWLKPRRIDDIFHEPTLTSKALWASAEDLFRIVRLNGWERVYNASRGILHNLAWLPVGPAATGISAAAAGFRDARIASGDPRLDAANAATSNYLEPLLVRNALACAAAGGPRHTVGELFARSGENRDRILVVAGAGGSLDDALDALRRNRDRFVLLAVDAAVGPLLAAGLRPDLAISVDPMRAVADFFAGLDTAGIPLVATVSIHPEAAAAWAGPVLLGACPPPSRHLMQVYTLFPDLATFLPHANCGSTGVLLGLDLRFRELLLVGIDFAFTNDRYYCRNVRHPNAALVGRAALLAALGARALERIDVRGNAVLTDPTFDHYAQTLQGFVGERAAGRVFNAGAGICDRFATVDLDRHLHARFAGEGNP